MAEKSIGQAVYEKAREEWHQNYLADAHRTLNAFMGYRLDAQTHREIQQALDHCYARWSVIQDVPLARLILKPFGKMTSIEIEMHWPPRPESTTPEITPWTVW